MAGTEIDRLPQRLQFRVGVTVMIAFEACPVRRCRISWVTPALAIAELNEWRSEWNEREERLRPFLPFASTTFGTIFAFFMITANWPDSPLRPRVPTPRRSGKTAPAFGFFDPARSVSQRLNSGWSGISISRPVLPWVNTIASRFILTDSHFRSARSPSRAPV